MNELKSEIAKSFSVDEPNEALNFYLQNMSSGKVLIRANNAEEKGKESGTESEIKSAK
jgi:hypothetical protein